MIGASASAKSGAATLFLWRSSSIPLIYISVVVLYTELALWPQATPMAVDAVPLMEKSGTWAKSRTNPPRAPWGLTCSVMPAAFAIFLTRWFRLTTDVGRSTWRRFDWEVPWWNFLNLSRFRDSQIWLQKPSRSVVNQTSQVTRIFGLKFNQCWIDVWSLYLNRVGAGFSLT